MGRRSGGKTDRQAGEARASRSWKEVKEEELEELSDQVFLFALFTFTFVATQVMFYSRGKLDLNSAILASLQPQSEKTFRLVLPKMSPRSSQTAADRRQKRDSSVKR